MGLTLIPAPGATPLDPDDQAGLIPTHIATQGELDEWEQQNILNGAAWAYTHRGEILDELFLRKLHKEMLGNTWRWAGTFRTSDKNIGVDWRQVAVKIRDLLENVRYQIEHKIYTPDEIAIRFHHALVWIHPFPNGNGRHARIIADLLIENLGQPKFTWGSQNLNKDSEVRNKYLAALRAADKRDYAPIFAFARN